MKEPFRFECPVPKRYRAGPLGGYVERFAAWLRERQYARVTARDKIRVVTDLSLWLQRRGLSVQCLDERSVARFLRNRGRRDFVRRGEAAVLTLFLDLLRDAGAICRPVCSALAEPSHYIERDFEQYLTQERRLSPATQRHRLRFVKRFLEERFGTNSVSLQEISASNIHSFVLRHARAHSPGRAKIMVVALRSFFRFLKMRGDIASDLAAAVPAVAGWRLSGVPKSIGPTQVRRLLRSCDRNTPTGRRDYAVLLLLARLGLRGGEVAALSLDDIDWHAGRMTIRGKGARLDQLPLPKDVGEALVDYLRRGRPRCANRRIFLTAKAPIHDLTRYNPVAGIVRRALDRAGLDPPTKGAHLLRHSLATNMLRRGASLAEIGELLRHQRLDTTAIYAKVDLTALRALAPRWPGGAA